MQVTQQAAHLTHAVINAGEQMSFGVSDDPMFFHMLYSSLYGNPMRAAFREPLCNAWDANIDNGMELTPLEITLTESSVTIKDSGKGIPHDMISEIYLTLGKSTKVQQADQTGGFGLGCKAPFAYAEHFEVRSYCNGVCTVYRMLKVCPERGGRPAATVIASFPTKESGLAVTIPFVIHGHDESGQPRSNDYTKIKRYIVEAISQGGILATINGVAVPTIPLKREPGAWAISQGFGLGNSNYIFVRYGSVIYPVEQMEGMQGFREVSNILNNSFSGYGSRIVFQAPPDSIVIPPNREAISTHPKTVSTMNTLFNGFLLEHKESIKNIPPKEYHQVISTVLGVSVATLPELVRGNLKEFMGVTSFMDSSGSILTDAVFTNTDDVVKAHMHYRDSPFGRFDKNYLSERLFVKAMVKCGYLTDHMAKLINANHCVGKSHRYDYAEWVNHNILHPLVKRMMRGGLNAKNLHIYDHYASNIRSFMRPWNDHRITSKEKLVLAARKIIILSYNKTDAYEIHGSTHSAINSANGGRSCAMVYLCPKGNGAAAKARAVFGKFKDCKLIDLTVARDKEEAQARKQRAEEAAAERKRIAELVAAGQPLPDEPVKVAKPIGFPSLMNAYEDGSLNFRTVKAGSHYRVEKPKFWLNIPKYRPRERANRLQYDVDASDSLALLKPYREWGILPMNQKMEKYIADNKLPEFKEFLMQQLERDLGNCKQVGLFNGTKISNIRAVVVGNKEGLLAPHKVHFYKLLRDDTWLRQYFGLSKPNIARHIVNRMSLLNTVIHSGYLTGDDHARMTALRDKVSTPVVTDAAKAVFVLVSKTPEIRYVSTSSIAFQLENGDKSVRMKARKFILSLLNK